MLKTKIKRKINLKNDREYQLAKEVIKNYENKVYKTDFII